MIFHHFRDCRKCTDAGNQRSPSDVPARHHGKSTKDDNLLKLFNIPKSFCRDCSLPQNRRLHDMVTGRLDFCMMKRGLKVYEYNADSASRHAETGVIINKWRKQGGLTEGWDPGNACQKCWRISGNTPSAKPFIHIMQDKGREKIITPSIWHRAITAAEFTDTGLFTGGWMN